MIKAILFDVDGTLVDTNDLHAAAWQQAFRHFGIEIDYEKVRGQIGKGGDNLIPALLPPEIVEQRQEEMEEYRSGLFKRDYLPRAVPFAGVRELFERLYGDGIKIVLASSSTAEEVDFHLGLIGGRDLVFAITSKDDVEHSKPCPDIFEAALAKVAPLGPREAIVVGDTPYDMQAAGKAGMRGIGVRSGGFADGALRSAGAAELYDGPRDLLACYDASLIVAR